MSLQLISRSPDLKRLRDEGFEIEVRGGHLIVRHVPYVNEQCEVKFGILVSELTLANPHETATPGSHTMFFQGDKPCHEDGKPLIEIINNSNSQNVADLIVQHYFSSKPISGRYDDYFEKITTYVAILCSPAQALKPEVTAQTFKVIETDEEESVFHYFDTNASRANIEGINKKLYGQKVAIIGLGGSGSYVLDFISKNPVEKIYLFDADDFLQHNAFRSPGAISVKQLNKKIKKVKYFFKTYSRMHKGIVWHEEYLTEVNQDLLKEMTYVFVCVDDGSARKLIIEYLQNKSIAFLDIGIGVNTVDDMLIGTVRVTVGTEEKCDHLERRIPFEDSDVNEYSNVQLAELNALGAVLAVIKWKKMSGFYQDLAEEHHLTYSVNVSQLLADETTAPDS